MKAAIIILISTLFCGCYSKKLKSNILSPSVEYNQISGDIPMSKLIENRSYYWKLDSLGTNGYRLSEYRALKTSKILDVDYEYVISKFGQPVKNVFNPVGSSKYLMYYIFNTPLMGSEWEKVQVVDYFIFEFDSKTEKLIQAFRSGN